MSNGVYELVQTTITDLKPGTPSDDGWYNFCAPPGTYYVEVIMPPLGLVRARPNIGNNDNIDSDLTGFFGGATSDPFVLSSTNDILNIDGGFYPMATAGNRVWFDSDFDGVQDAGEPNISDVVVEVFEVNTGEKVAEATTNASGVYSIEYLRKEDYYLRFTPPSGYAFTVPNQGSELEDSDVDGTFGFRTTRAYSMLPGQNYINIDAGLQFGVLPVEWLSVNATWNGDANEVTWATATEVNAEEYVIERRREEDTWFTAVGTVKAVGESTTRQDYQFDDEDIYAGRYYYRIMQVDIDGKFEYSDVVSVDVESLENTVDLAPNPAKDRTTISLRMNSNTAVQVAILANDGRLVRSYNVGSQNGANVGTDLIIEELPAGVYFVRVVQDDFVTVKKLIMVE